ncbi:hypothetical protein E2C01_066090 [Portunus trituberculatus]|uniref:Uncharacterized protein n=1 Tax=Portunus trituberculatus TaxID=210409 RepID=A0A5B7HHA7_PORTR|nr:hypothetical protein [Portunus trituberculatus]
MLLPAYCAPKSVVDKEREKGDEAPQLPIIVAQPPLPLKSATYTRIHQPAPRHPAQNYPEQDKAGVSRDPPTWTVMELTSKSK